MLWKLLLLFVVNQALALTIELEDTASIHNASSIIVNGLLDYYTGNEYGKPVGMFSNPYYWWQSGAAWGSILDYWWYTGDTQYNEMLTSALLAQTGANWDYVPQNQSTTEGNDDQGFWGLTVMAAVERNYTNPSPDQPQWLYLAQAVFNTMSGRWDDEHCHGGLRWQIFQWNSGYDYKNTVSNGVFFQLGARLARYTSNDTYVEWCERIWNWLEGTELVSITEGQYIMVYDGTKVADNCTNVVKLQWTYNAALLLGGCAYLSDYTSDPKWHERAVLLLNGISVFFDDAGVMSEAACQSQKTCNNDQRSFKAYFSRFMSLTAQLMPAARDVIDHYLQQSALAAAQSCSGGTDGVTCGMNWQEEGWDGLYGLGEQMSALETIQNLLYKDMPLPFTNSTGGSSQGDPEAGKSMGTSNLDDLNITTGDRVGAALTTAFIGLTMVVVMLFVLV